MGLSCGLIKTSLNLTLKSGVGAGAGASNTIEQSPVWESADASELGLA